MTLKQANQVNSYYIDRESTIRSLNDSLRKQKSISQLEAEYFNYVQSELLRNGTQGNQALIDYYQRREDMMEKKVHRYSKNSLYIFIGMIFLFLLK
jgi:hypothetical protein